MKFPKETENFNVKTGLMARYLQREKRCRLLTLLDVNRLSDTNQTQNARNQGKKTWLDAGKCPENHQSLTFGKTPSKFTKGT